MGVTQWNDAEEEALQGLPWLAQLIYLRGLRRFMDYRTGIVGEKRRISYRCLAETLYVEPCQGRKSFGAPTQKAIRFALESLARAGLVESLSHDRSLIFRLPLADADESVQKKWGRFGADEGQRKWGIEDSNEDMDLSDKRGRFGADEGQRKWGTPPESDIRKEERERACEEIPPASSPAKQDARGARLSLSDLPKDWESWCADHRPDLDAHSVWPVFRDYWIAQPGQGGMKTDWFATWRNWCRREDKVNGTPHPFAPGLSKADIERAARPGETYEQVAVRLRQTRL